MNGEATDTAAPGRPGDDDLLTFVTGARWFGGKGRGAALGEVRRIGGVRGPDDDGAGAAVDVWLVEIRYDDGDTERYQVPISLRDDAPPRLEHALIGTFTSEDRTMHGYDAVHDREATSLLLRAFADADLTADGLRFVRLPGHELDLDATGAPFGGEQSNSSVFFGEDAVLKLFRKVTAGENPDVLTHRMLTEAGSTHVARLYGWLEHDDTHLGMLQQFLRTASDGWDLALASVRNLFAEADLHADEVGGDFAGEAARLGGALAEVHAQLRGAFPASRVAADRVAATMLDRFEAARAVVPALEEHADGVRAVFGDLADAGTLATQRIHGDLHLGQTLRTVAGWKLVDFEGEPAKDLAERLLPDSPWRDVAGMTRSFDYAPHAVAASLDDVDEDVVHQRSVRAAEWARRNRKAFLEAYTAGSGLSPLDRVVLTAYVVDKAVYECVYEARNRPTWLSIPLEGVARLTSAPSGAPRSHP